MLLRVAGRLVDAVEHACAELQHAIYAAEARLGGHDG
jgi:hypothetical protein